MDTNLFLSVRRFSEILDGSQLRLQETIEHVETLLRRPFPAMRDGLGATLAQPRHVRCIVVESHRAAHLARKVALGPGARVDARRRRFRYRLPAALLRHLGAPQPVQVDVLDGRAAGAALPARFRRREQERVDCDDGLGRGLDAAAALRSARRGVQLRRGVNVCCK